MTKYHVCPDILDSVRNVSWMSGCETIVWCRAGEVELLNYLLVHGSVVVLWQRYISEMRRGKRVRSLAPLGRYSR